MAEKDTGPGSGRPSATRRQHAIRLLALLNQCGEPVTDIDPAGTVKVVRSEMSLQAMDFWMRNPDYLADELLTAVEQGLESTYVERARQLLDDPEPDLHWYPMPRWFFGAYEALDDAFAQLEVYGLAAVRRSGVPGKKAVRTQFYLTSSGGDAVVDLARDATLSWYPRQAKLVHLVASDDLGAQLKTRQYKQATYAGTELGSHIGPIADRVRARLSEWDALATATAGHDESGDES